MCSDNVDKNCAQWSTLKGKTPKFEICDGRMNLKEILHPCSFISEVDGTCEVPCNTGEWAANSRGKEKVEEGRLICLGDREKNGVVPTP